MRKINNDKKNLAYIIGLALGDGNLSNPNGRATRLRITCDKKYPLVLKEAVISVRKLLPQNKVSLVNRKTCIDVSCYSNYWESLLGWKALGGSKELQMVQIPSWIKNDNLYAKECLRGLFQSDGSLYTDRGYLMTNFVSEIPSLANDVIFLIKKLGYTPNNQKLLLGNGKTKNTVRVSKRTKNFIKEINLWKK